jgi:hypothetical protein
MKDRMMISKKYFLYTIQLFALLLIIFISLRCGGGFRQDSENAQEFINPLFNNREFVSDTAIDTSHILR